MIIAKLLKDLPDIKAGALFKSISRRHWELENFPENYSVSQLFYFYDDSFENTAISAEGHHAVYFYTELIEWCLFFDYSCGEFKPLDEIKTLTPSELQ